MSSLGFLSVSPFFKLLLSFGDFGSRLALLKALIALSPGSCREVILLSLPCKNQSMSLTADVHKSLPRQADRPGLRHLQKSQHGPVQGLYLLDLG